MCARVCARGCPKLASTPGVLLCSRSTCPRGCALLEIKNLKSGETHEIPPEGALLGREGAKADIPIRDPGVSKKHARIFEKGGVWYLQDVGSSNGTFMQGKRLTGPTVLTEGAVFGMSRHKFKVTRIGNGAHAADEEPLYGDDLAPPPVAPAMEPRTPSRTPAPTRPPLPQDDYPPLSPSGPDEASYGDLAPTAPPSAATHPPMAAQGSAAVDEIEQKSIGAFFVALPKAIAYYLAAVPLFAVTPFGTVRKSIDEQPHPAMGPWELIAYALPAMVFGAVFSSWCGLIGSLIGGGGFQVGLLLPIVPVIVAVVGSAVSGFLLHPVLGWLVRVLKGSSDARSRTNYFLLSMTAYALLMVPSGLGALLSIANVPFLSILAPLLMLVASLLLLLVAYKWIVFFNVMKPVQIAVLVLGALGVVFTGVDVVKTTIDSFERVLGGASDPEAAAAKVAELQSKLAALATDSSLTPEERAKKAAKLTEELNAASEASKAAMEAAAASAAAAESAAEAGKEAAAEGGAAAAAAAATDAAKDAPKAASDAAKEAGKAAKEPKAAAAAPPPPAASSRSSLPKAPSDFSYPQFKDRRDKMEEALNKDVTLLSRVRGTLPAYQRYHQAKHEIDQRYAAETAARPDQKSVHERLAEEELYLRTYKDVQAFWRAIENYRP